MDVVIVTVSFKLLPYNWLFYRYEDVRPDFLLASSHLFDGALCSLEWKEALWDT